MDYWSLIHASDIGLPTAAADPGFAKGQGADHGEPERGCGGRAPSTGLMESEAETFCPFSYKKWPKVKHINENLTPCLRQTASHSHDQP